MAPQELPGLSSWSGKPSAFRRQHGRAGRPRCVSSAVLTGGEQRWCVKRAWREPERYRWDPLHLRYCCVKTVYPQQLHEP